VKYRCETPVGVTVEQEDFKPVTFLGKWSSDPENGKFINIQDELSKKVGDYGGTETTDVTSRWMMEKDVHGMKKLKEKTRKHILTFYKEFPKEHVSFNNVALQFLKGDSSLQGSDCGYQYEVSSKGGLIRLKLLIGEENKANDIKKCLDKLFIYRRNIIHRIESKFKDACVTVLELNFYYGGDKKDKKDRTTRFEDISMEQIYDWHKSLEGSPDLDDNISDELSSSLKKRILYSKAFEDWVKKLYDPSRVTTRDSTIPGPPNQKSPTEFLEYWKNYFVTSSYRGLSITVEILVDNQDLCKVDIIKTYLESLCSDHHDEEKEWGCVRKYFIPVSVECKGGNTEFHAKSLEQINKEQVNPLLFIIP
jgi:curved DNA-binding protein CbpA